MKLLNIFKKATSTSSVTERSNVQKLEKNQLSKVIGGSDSAEMPGGPLKGIGTARAVSTPGVK